jgi:hypothetical protein
MEAYWRRESALDGLIKVLNSYQQDFPPRAIHCMFTTNHDENSHNGTEFERMGDAAIAFAILCCTWNGIPLIYSGQELPNLKRLKFFDKDEIDWNGRFECKDFFTKLLLLRKRNKAMLAGDPQVKTRLLSTNDGQSLLSFLRSGYADEVLVILNLSAKSVLFASNGQLSGNYKELFSGEILSAQHLDGIDLEGWAYKVFEKLPGESLVNTESK